MAAEVGCKVDVERMLLSGRVDVNYASHDVDECSTPLILAA